MADSRRSWDEIHPWLPNGGLRPTAAIGPQILQRLLSVKWAFRTDLEPCRQCGGSVNVIASIEDPVIIEKILTHLNEKALPIEAPPLPKSRAPPQAGLFD
jgi:hypothetical protein